MNDNLELYESFRTPPSNALKPFDSGSFKGTDINTIWRIKTLTERYGACGIGWYYTIDKQWMESSNDTVMSFANISLYIKDGDKWSAPIAGTGGNKLSYKTAKGYIKVSDECFKMAVTDAFGNACRNLGMGADIYWAEDRTKYTPSPTTDNLKEWDKYNNILLDKAKILGIMPKDVPAAIEKKYKIKYYDATIEQLQQAIKDMEKKINELDPTT